MGTHQSLNLTGVSETLMIPLFCRAWESQKPDGLIHDPLAEQVMADLMPHLQASRRRFHQDIVQQRWPHELQLLLAERTRYFDQVAQAFISQHEDPQLVMLACGLDCRFERIGYPEVDWVILDLPEVMELRHELLPQHPRIREISASALDPQWMQALEPNRPTLIQAEGLLMYLPRQQIRHLFKWLGDYFQQAEFMAEVAAYWLSQLMSQGPFKGAFKHKFKLSSGTTFLGGLHQAREPESWHPHIRLLNEYTYFDRWEPQLGLMNLVGLTPFKRTQWIVHYRLENPNAPQSEKKTEKN